MIEAVAQQIDAFKTQASPGSWFLAAESDIEDHPSLLPYSHYLRQAWNELDLQGVLCVDDRPVVYLCAAQTFSTQKKRQYHSFTWNQGLVPILVFFTANHVEVHSAVKKPEKEEIASGLFAEELPSLISTLEHTAETLELAQLVRSIETGQFFQNNATLFPASDAVDRSLLRNLVLTARRLQAANWSRPRAHALLGRALFISFLHARKFIKPDYFPSGFGSLLEILSQPNLRDIKRHLYKNFFGRLKREFNGTMFDAALDDEAQHIEKVHVDILAFFLGRHDVGTGQMSLDFWVYDFRFIPVEIISAIYEEFMEGSDALQKRDQGAYYTPRHLAETVLHVALEGRYAAAKKAKVLDPACGSGIFLVAMFNLHAEQWRRENSNQGRVAKAQALLEILQTQIQGVDINLEACRITAFSLYLALFEKLKPMDVEEFKAKVNQGPFLPSLLWTADNPIDNPVVVHGDFIKETPPCISKCDFIIGNPPWENRGSQQIALHFLQRSTQFLRADGVGCLLLPSALLVNRNGALTVDLFREVAVEKIVQLSDFRFVLFEATHPCFILRYLKSKPSFNHSVIYETPKLNRFDRRQGVIIVEPDDQKVVQQRDILEAGLQDKLQSLWSRKFWGTPRDEAFLRRLDSFPRLADLVGLRGKGKRWLGGTGLQPHYEHRKYANYQPVKNPYGLEDAFLDAKTENINLVIFKDQLTTLGEKLTSIGASKTKVLFARTKENFEPPLFIYSKGFTKFAFSSHPVKFFDGLRSIAAFDKEDADLLRFLAAVFASRLFKYITFHGGSNFGVGRDQLHVYESLNLPFPLPDHELAPDGAAEIVADAAAILKALERNGKRVTGQERALLVCDVTARLEPLIEHYFRVTETEKMLIDDTLKIFQPSIHRHSLDGDIPSLEFPDTDKRKLYADTLCSTLNRIVRKDGIRISADAKVSTPLNLILMTVVFGETAKPYNETTRQADLWNALERIATAAQRHTGPFSYLRGFSYFESDRLHMLKPATTRNWSRTAALNDADAIFEYLARKVA